MLDTKRTDAKPIWYRAYSRVIGGPTILFRPPIAPRPRIKSVYLDNNLKLLARPEGFEPPAYGFEVFFEKITY